MRIGIDARLGYYSPGGIGQYTKEIITHLALLDLEDTFIVFQSRRDRSPIATGANLTRWPLWTPPHHRWEQWTLPLEIRFASVDLLHSPDFIPPLHRGFPTVITVHDLAFVRYPQFLTREARRYYGQLPRAARNAEAIIAVSNHTKMDLMDLMSVPEEKIHVIYEAPAAHFHPWQDGEEGSTEKIASRLKAVGSEPFILFVGTLEPRKNLPTLVKAFSRMKEARELRLIMVGAKGWLCEDIFSLVHELQLEDRVLFWGPASQEDLLFLYNKAVFLVLPSYYEGFGLPLLEAMACGLPAVASQVSSLPEIAGEAALLFDPWDTQSLVEAMGQLWEDSTLRMTLRDRGLQQAAKFRWENAARETLSVYHLVGKP